MNLTVDHKAPSNSVTPDQFKELHRKYRGLSDKFREGKLKIIAIPENTNTSKEIIFLDRQVTYDETGISCNISRTQML